jgi:ribosomal protein L19
MPHQNGHILHSGKKKSFTKIGVEWCVDYHFPSISNVVLCEEAAQFIRALPLYYIDDHFFIPD